MATEEVVFTFRFEEGAAGGGAPVGGGLPTDAASAAARAAQGLQAPSDAEGIQGEATRTGRVAETAIGTRIAAGAITAGTVAAAASIAAGAIAVRALVSQVDAFTDRLEEFSPALSAEQARSEALATVQAVRQAQEVGPTLAEFQREREELARAISDIQVALLKEVVPLATSILKGINSIAKIATDEQNNENRPALLLSRLQFLSEENPGLLRGFLTTELDPIQVGITNEPPLLPLL